MYMYVVVYTQYTVPEISHYSHSSCVEFNRYLFKLMAFLALESAMVHIELKVIIKLVMNTTHSQFSNGLVLNGFS